MILKRLAVLTCAGLFMAQAAIAQTDEYDDRWYGTVFGGWAGLDDDRGSIDNDAVLGLGIGRFFSPNFSVDLEYDRINSDISGLAAGIDSDFKMNSLGLIARYHLLDSDSKARPYILAGLGGTDHSGGFSGSTDLYWTAGAGVRFAFSDHWSARVQAAYRYDGDDVRSVRRDGFNDVLVTGGLTYAFGERRRAPVAQAKPVAAPVPAPPPVAPAPPAVDGDDDGDGVLNSRDRCPETRAGAVVDLNGCEADTKIDLPGVNFEFDSAKLTTASLAILNEAAALLNHHKQVKVEVAGHTDSKGRAEYNQSLSEKRAKAVRDYLIGKGVSADRLTSNGYGETRPVATNDTDAGRARNRRTELTIISQ